MSDRSDGTRPPEDRGPVLDKLEALLARQRIAAGTSPSPAPARQPPAAARPSSPSGIPLLSEAVDLPGDRPPGLPGDGVPTLTEALPAPLPGTPTLPRAGASVAPASREALRAALVARLPANLEAQVRAQALATLDRVVEEHARTLTLWRQRQVAQLEARVRGAVDRAIDEAVDRALLGARPPPRP